MVSQYVIVTGAYGGIGQALVQTFTHAGYNVIACDINKKVASLDCKKSMIVDLEKTVNDEYYAETVFNEIKAEINGSELKALINNAAVQILGSTNQLKREDWHKTINVNLLAPFVWIQGLLDGLTRADGSVVNIGSIHSRLTKKKFVAYATSKAALAGMARALAVDLGDKVRINTIEPAAIDTDMLRAGFEGKDQLYKQLISCHPQKRIGTPQEVAELALMLINNKLRFLHGATIKQDGGISGRLFDPDEYK